MRFNEVAVEAAAISVANKTMVGGAATGLVGWLSQINWIGVIGAAVAIIGLAANIYFQLRRDRRESAESRAVAHQALATTVIHGINKKSGCRPGVRIYQPPALRGIFSSKGTTCNHRKTWTPGSGPG